VTSGGTICPHCGRPFGGIRYGVTFGPVAIKIIDTIKRAGPDGIDSDDLFEIVYSGRSASREAMKGYIRLINHQLRGISSTRIVNSLPRGGARRGDYRIVEHKVRSAA
jgi:DNA-binding winged helix-turn-helix (wHTH) protein